MTNLKKNKSETKGVELHIQGIVQGVGFRPFIYNLARQLKISGAVSNTSAGVFIQAFADARCIELFTSRIRAEAPPLAQIFSIDVRPITTPAVTEGFTIVASDTGTTACTAIPPDIALCRDCLEELLSPENRRYNYPFINCTNCGPRFTIVENIPYDRPKTSMKVFPMCDKCLAEYGNPQDRRFHAQPNACPDCGPSISWHAANGDIIKCSNPFSALISALNDDKIVAIRGLGGFHLAANACSEKAVALLRARKHRPTKPLAIMTAGLLAAADFSEISKEEAQQLSSPQHPIVLLHKKAGSLLAPNLCTGVDDIGIMLPYTPLHHLLFKEDGCPPALVMTSGNQGGHPICITNESALEELSSIADFFLLHNREILTRVDDSVTKIMQNNFRIFRRARGYSPSPLQLAEHLPRILGCGGGLKSTFCLGRDNLAFLSQHIGDLFNLESYEFYRESIAHHQKVFEIIPEIVVRDLHPDYMSSHYAAELKVPLYTAQHHHAHAVAVMAEHHIQSPVLAIVLDGTGYGDDGTIWGGEILLSRRTSYTRLAHLQYLSLPGGDKAAMEPWRMAMSALYHTFGSEGLKEKNLPQSLHHIAYDKREILLHMVQKGLNTPQTSSCGRLFDAVAALLNLRLNCDYEGHAAMELEALAAKSLKGNWKSALDPIMAQKVSPFFRCTQEKWEIISTKFVTLILDQMAIGQTPSRIALAFHIELIGAIAKLTQHLATQYDIHQVVLSGGCMQNRLLMEGLFYLLEKEGLHVFTGQKVPVNDGGISFGQIIIGGLQHVSSNTNESYQG